MTDLIKDPFIAAVLCHLPELRHPACLDVALTVPAEKTEYGIYKCPGRIGEHYFEII